MLRDSAVRTGVVVGVGLSLALSGWIISPTVCRFSIIFLWSAILRQQHDQLLAFLPVLRFFREPGTY